MNLKVRSKKRDVRSKSGKLLVAVCALALTAAAPVSLPRTSDGHPDLQGVWANDTVTMLERPSRFGDKEVFSEQEAIE